MQIRIWNHGLQGFPLCIHSAIVRALRTDGHVELYCGCMYRVAWSHYKCSRALLLHWPTISVAQLKA